MKAPMRRGGFLKSGRWLAGALMLSTGSAAAEPVSFARGIAPIFQRQCVGCHKAGKAKGKYRLDTYSHAMKELVAGNLEESELYYRITTDDEDDRMPVEANPLSKQEIELIRKWIEEGAKYDAEDPEALLSSIVPMEEHPAAPESYPAVTSGDRDGVFQRRAETFHRRLSRDPGLGIRRMAPCFVGLRTTGNGPTTWPCHRTGGFSRSRRVHLGSWVRSASSKRAVVRWWRRPFVATMLRSRWPLTRRANDSPSAGPTECFGW